ncbi:carboxymuconolactone decarboxylase family protein [Streptomyces sp. NPDC008238]
MHTKTALEKGINPDKVAHLASWRQSMMFHAAEQAALAYCEGLTNYDLNAFPALHEELTNHFTETEIAELAAVIINMNVWTRLKLAQGATPDAVTDDADPVSS